MSSYIHALSKNYGGETQSYYFQPLRKENEDESRNKTIQSNL